MRDKRYLSTALAVYLSYFMHGMAVIMISQHKPFFLEHWSNETGAGVAYAISAIGLGKLLAQYLGGWMADRFGRRPSLIIAMIMCAVFFFGLAFAPNWIVASLLGFLFGCANAVVDGGAYPTLMEVFPRVAGSANVAVKAFIAGGQYLLPVIIGMSITRSLQWNIALLVAGAIMLALFVLMLLVPFPDYKAIAAEEAAELERFAEENAVQEDEPACAPVSKFAVEGVAIIAMGFTTLGGFWLAQNSLPDFGKSLAGMSDVAAAGLTSTYALGSLISVFVTAILVAKAIKPVYFLVIGPLGTALGYLGLAFFSTAGAPSRSPPSSSASSPPAASCSSSSTSWPSSSRAARARSPAWCSRRARSPPSSCRSSPASSTRTSSPSSGWARASPCSVSSSASSSTSVTPPSSAAPPRPPADGHQEHLMTITVRGTELGSGRPKIIVPITAKDLDGALDAVGALVGQDVDLVEWRIDHFRQDLTELDAYEAAVIDGAQRLRAALDEFAVDGQEGLPLLVTFRTAAEGGERAIEDADYAALLSAVVAAGGADLVDVEAFRDADHVAAVIDAAHTVSTVVIASDHDFHATPALEEIVSRLERMRDMGADVAKIAVMPQDPADVLTLLRATWDFHTANPDTPIITMSMGATGVVSRVAGRTFGSAATFGTVGAASAPGQIPTGTLAQVMDALSD